MSTRQMHLALFFRPTGHHQAAWLHPDSQPDAASNFEHIVSVAQTAERACLDCFFVGDTVGVRVGDPSAIRRVAQYMNNFEPLTLISALSTRTEKIGLVATVSASFNEPYNVARKFASLDIISGGRVGWNVVTSGVGESPNFGVDEHLEHDTRYDRALEFVEVCKGLWDSFEDDAFLRDRETGVFTDLDKMHVLDHHGRFFDVRGPLNSSRTPQAYPVIAQAGISPAGQKLASRHADMVFTTSQKLEDAKKLYARIKEQAADAGRDPNAVKVMPGLVVVPGRTDEEARENYELLQAGIHLDVALSNLAMKTFADLAGLSPDAPMPLSVRPEGDAATYFDEWYEIGQREGLSLRELAVRAAVTGYVGLPLVGSGATLADVMEQWFTEDAADGFTIMPSYIPGGFDRFADQVVPELQRRGLFRTEYTGSTLREHFGVPRPAWRSHTQD